MLNLQTYNKILGWDLHVARMRDICEDSPYHREPTVLFHTCMVVDCYDNFAANSQDWYWLGRFACLLHDVAKPVCRTRKENAKRGIYYSYDRHDVVGAEMAEQILSKHGVSEFDTYRISWMIAHHQIFWSTKDNSVKVRMAEFLRKHDCYLPFKYFMLADDFGRICDERTIESIAFFAAFEREYMN